MGSLFIILFINPENQKGGVAIEWDTHGGDGWGKATKVSRPITVASQKQLL